MTRPAEQVGLREITADTMRGISGLAVAPEQERFVASNAVSLAQALFSPETWYRPVHAGEAPAGFVMLYDESLRPAFLLCIPRSPSGAS